MQEGEFRKSRRMICIEEKLVSQIRKEGEEHYPAECCGIVYGYLGSDGSRKALFIEPVLNETEKRERFHRFLISGESLLRAERRARKEKCDIIGFYHSHPDHPAFASDYDRSHAFPEYSYLIVSVIKGKADEFLSWQLAGDRFGQEEVRIYE